MPQEGKNTAIFLHLMDGIADALNGSASREEHSKRIPWTANSYHSAFLKLCKTFDLLTPKHVMQSKQIFPAYKI